VIHLKHQSNKKEHSLTENKVMITACQTWASDNKKKANPKYPNPHLTYTNYPPNSAFIPTTQAPSSKTLATATKESTKIHRVTISPETSHRPFYLWSLQQRKLRKMWRIHQWAIFNNKMKQQRLQTRNKSTTFMTDQALNWIKIRSLYLKIIKLMNER